MMIGWNRDLADGDPDIEAMGDLLNSAGLEPAAFIGILRPIVWQFRGLHAKGREKHLSPDGQARLCTLITSSLLTSWWGWEGKADAR
jgi:hypothetical protein